MTRLTPTHALGRLRDLWSDTSERIGLCLLGSGVFCLLLSAAIGLRLRSPFGHDESVYALKARELANPGQMHVYQYWSAYRAPGFPAVLSLVFRVKESALAARGLIVLFSILTLWCVWAIGRKLVDPVTGGLAALLTAITPAFAAMSTFVLVDGPGAALSLLAILLFLPILEGRISWWRSAAVIAVCWAATTVRFGAPLCYGVGLGALGLVAAVRSLKDRDWRRILNVAVVGIGALAAIPGLYSSQLFAVDGTSPKAANDALRGSKNLTVWTGWRDLRQWFIDEVMHNRLEYAFTIVVLIGVLAAVVLAVRRRELRLPLGFFLFCALGGLVGLVVSVGLIVTNYLMIVMPFVALAAAVGFVGVSRMVAPRREFAFVALVLLGLLGTAASMDRTRDYHRTNRIAAGALQTAARITADELGPNCMLITSYFVQTSWYSNCAGYSFHRPTPNSTEYKDVPTTAADAFAYWTRVAPQDASPDHMALLIVDHGKRQPTAEQIAAGEPLNLRVLYTRTSRGRATTLSQLMPCFFTDTCPTT